MSAWQMSVVRKRLSGRGCCSTRLCRSFVIYLSVLVSGCAGSRLFRALPPSEVRAARAAQGMIKSSEGTLAPVYSPLAEYITNRFGLADKQGIGIDVGRGPGNLIIELCRRTRLHWINADINPHFFAHFMDRAHSEGVGHRVSALFADVHSLPFRDDYADAVVSRGSFHLWNDKPKAFREIHRVLKPGGMAFVGRGFSPDLPVETARQIRAAQAPEGFPNYDVQETKADLHREMKAAGISDYTILIPESPRDKAVRYGIWVEFQK